MRPIPNRNQLENKRLSCALSLKSVDAEGRFAGYASVFDVLDSQRDRMLRGAFHETLKLRGHAIKLLWQHQFEEPIGVITRIFEDGRGLYVEGKLLLEVARAREAHALLRAGAISGLSIGYSPVRYRVDPETGARNLAAVELWEVSLVTFPANEQANVTVVKGFETRGQRPGKNFSAELEVAQRSQLIELMDAITRARNALR